MRVMALFSTSFFAKYLRVGEDGPGRGHLYHTDTFLVVFFFFFFFFFSCCFVFVRKPNAQDELLSFYFTCHLTPNSKKNYTLETAVPMFNKFIQILLRSGERTFVQMVTFRWSRCAAWLYMVTTLKNLHIQNQESFWAQLFWYGGLPRLFKWWPYTLSFINLSNMIFNIKHSVNIYIMCIVYSKQYVKINSRNLKF